MNIIMAAEDWREPKTKGISNLISPHDHSCDNALLFSSEYMVELARQTRIGAVSMVDAVEEWTWFDSFWRSCEVAPGLLARYPGDKEGNSHDDHTGVVAASQAFASRFYEQGMRNGWSWNVKQPGVWTLQTWYGRIAGFVPFARARVQGKLDRFDRVWFALGCRLSLTGKNDESGLKLQYLKNLAVFGQGYEDLDAEVRAWDAEMLKRYPGGMAEVYGIYFSHDHPLAGYGNPGFVENWFKS